MSVDEGPVVCLLQPNFVDILRNEDAPSKVFTVQSFDESDTLHLRVKLSAEENQKERHVVYKLLQKLPEKEEEALECAVELFKSLPETADPQVALVIAADDLAVAFVRADSSQTLKKARVLRQPCKGDLYSRSKGILETSLLESRKVAVIGLGSGGSHIALELAKAGVGKFVLVDFDRVELHNIIRHVCGMGDLGRLKTNAIRDRILDKNPFAEIECYTTSINNLEEGRKIIEGCDLVIAATDNIRSRLNINSLTLELNVPTLYGKCAIRAAGGEILRVRPKQSPCFSCVYTDAMVEASSEETTSFRQAREAHPSYVPDDEVAATIQVGLSSDITPIANMIVKLALVELCRGNDSALAPLEQDLQAPYYMWANRREDRFSAYKPEGFHRFDKPGILRWYPADMEIDPKCKACQEIKVSDENVGFFSS